MDIQPTPPNGQNQQQTPTPTSTPAPGTQFQPSQETPPPPQQPINPEPAPAPKPKKKKTLLWVLLAVLLIGGGAAAGWWFFMREDTTTDTTTTQTDNNQTDTETETEVVSAAPYTLAYAFGDASKETPKFFWRPVEGGDRTEANTLALNDYVVSSGTKNEQLYATVDSTTGGQVWYSADSGKTYKKVFQGKAGTGGGLGEQVSSAVFANDGTAMLIGVVGTSGGNTVKEISLPSGEAVDVFTTKDAGVFLYGYDNAKQLVYYNTGCYNCDGNNRNTLLARNIAEEKDTTLYTAPTGQVGVQLVLNEDFTKLLTVTGLQGDGPGTKAPYLVNEITFEGNVTTELLSSAEETAPIVGYSTEDKSYYTKGNSVYLVDKDTLLFEAGKPIIAVQYVGKDNVVASAGAYDDFSILNYTFSTKNLVSILDGDQNTRTFGVTVKN